MATRQENMVLHHLRRAILLDGGAGLTDSQLLGCFVDQRDEAAFAALVRRHGPMVLSVCRRIVGNFHDADDAFQATFLVLVRKASSVKPRELVANWLYGVAHHTALKARALAARRQAREKQVIALPEPEAALPNADLDLHILLDQELSRLPDKYRVPIVLCDLEGKSRREAARQLGWLDGTLSGRLARARQLLAKRLTQRGFVVSAGVVAVVVSQAAVPASVPASLLMATVKSASVFAMSPAAGVVSVHAATLAEGVLKSMLLAKLKTVMGVFLLVGVVGVGLGFSTAGRSTAQGKAQPGIAQKEAPGAARDKEAPLKDRRDDKVDEKVAEDKLRADALADQVAQLQAKCEELQRAILVTQRSEKDQQAAKDEVIQKLKDEILVLRTKLAEIQAQPGMRPVPGPGPMPGMPGLGGGAVPGAKKRPTAENDLKTAEYYRASAHPESAAFYYELVIRRYPGTSYAKEAAKRREELFEKFEKEQEAAAIPQLREQNERLRQQYEKARKEADDLRDQIERLRKSLEKTPSGSTKP